MLKSVILGFSGVTVDKYSCAIPFALKDLLKRNKISISWNRIKEISQSSNFDEFQTNIKKENTGLTDKAINCMYIGYVKHQLNTVRRASSLIPYSARVVEELRDEYNMKIGCTTNLNKQNVDLLINTCKKNGLYFNSVVSSDQELNKSKDSPFILYKNLYLQGIYPIHNVVKVGSTIEEVKEGINAGCWSVGIAKFSKHTGINNPKEWLTECEYNRKIHNSKKILLNEGAHYVCESIKELPEVIEHINYRLKCGDRPQVCPLQYVFINGNLLDSWDYNSLFDLDRKDELFLL